MLKTSCYILFQNDLNGWLEIKHCSRLNDLYMYIIYHDQAPSSSPSPSAVSIPTSS